MFVDRLIAALRQAASWPAAIFSNDNAVGEFQRAADGGVVFTSKVVAAAAPETVFGMLDPSCAANRWARRGDRVDAVDAARGLYRLTDRRMPEAPFLLQVEEASSPALMAATIVGDGGQPFGAVEKSRSRYSIAPHPDGCEITLTERTYFLEAITPREFKQHAQLMNKSVAADLARLKGEAETVHTPPVAASA